MKKNKSTITLILFISLIFSMTAFAETKVFEKEVDEIVSRDQSQEQVESFALQKAKRLAVEEAGTYISSLTVVKNSNLEKDEITALASGVVQSKIIGIPSVTIDNAIIHVKVKARVEVDTSILDKQIQELLKETDTLKKLEAERKKNKELEDQIANLKSSETKRLDDLNAQVAAIEHARAMQRLFLEEQTLRAKGELKKSEIERLKKEKEYQDKINSILLAQEEQRRREADAIAKEQDKLKKARLENEQQWNELERKTKLAQSLWSPIDDSLSIKQATEEVIQIKAEITNINQRVEIQNLENKKNIEQAYNHQITLIQPSESLQPEPKGKFESTNEYNKRIGEYNKKISNEENIRTEKIVSLKEDETTELNKAEIEYIKQKINLVEPFVKRLEYLQTKNFIISDDSISTSLGEPEPDVSRFPITLTYKGNEWNMFWEYKDKEKAKELYQTRIYLKSEGIFRLADTNRISQFFCGFRVISPGTGVQKDFIVATPKAFSEITDFSNLKHDEKNVENRIQDKNIKDFKKAIGYDEAKFPWAITLGALASSSPFSGFDAGLIGFNIKFEKRLWGFFGLQAAASWFPHPTSNPPEKELSGSEYLIAIPFYFLDILSAKLEFGDFSGIMRTNYKTIDTPNLKQNINSTFYGISLGFVPGASSKGGLEFMIGARNYQGNNEYKGKTAFNLNFGYVIMF